MRYSRIISQSLSRHKTPIFQNPSHRFRSLNFRLLNVACYLTSSLYFFKNSNSIRPNVEPWNVFNLAREFTSSAHESKIAPSERVSAIVDEVSSLTLLEVAELAEVLRERLDVKEMPVMAVMMPGMGLGMRGSTKGGGAASGEEKKVEKTAFDLKLEGGYDAAAKIKIIKEVRACTDLGLKEAKDLVEKAPTLLKKGVPKEEAEKIIEKMKGVGAKVTME